MGSRSERDMNKGDKRGRTETDVIERGKARDRDEDRGSSFSIIL